MSEIVSKISVFIGSPSDVAEERKIVTQAVEDLNVGFASSRRMLLELKRWETHVWPGFGDDAQDVINERVGEYDIFIGIFWNRFGTPTSRAQSGTAEEFERAYATWKGLKASPQLLSDCRRNANELLPLRGVDRCGPAPSPISASCTRVLPKNGAALRSLLGERLGDDFAAFAERAWTILHGRAEIVRHERLAAQA